MDIARLAQTRHTCKAYDPTRKISDEHIGQLLACLRYAPSSVNSQPWHFIVAASDAAKARLARATQHAVYAANTPKILHASHVVVLCAHTAMDAAQIDAVTDREAHDGRFADAAAQAAQRKSRAYYVDLHRCDLKDTQHWMEKQVYLALGGLLLGAASLGIDATPIEGFDGRALNEELGLCDKGLTSVVLAALGYRSDADFNARLPKSRLPAERVISTL